MLCQILIKITQNTQRFAFIKGMFIYFNSANNYDANYLFADNGFLKTKMTESPRKNIFEMNRSLFTGLTFFLPFPDLGISVHISLTLFEKNEFIKREISTYFSNILYLSKTMLQ